MMVVAFTLGILCLWVLVGALTGLIGSILAPKVFVDLNPAWVILGGPLSLMYLALTL